MPSLHKLQSAFSAALINDANFAIAQWLDDCGIAGRNALGVYRNNVREAFVSTLATTYPVLKRLVGHDFFRQMTKSYQVRFPSRKGNLFYVGQMMPEFLQQEFGGTEYAYLIDIARLEWACQQTLIAGDSEELNRESLLDIDPAVYARLRFHLHPSVQLFQSSYPILRIWRDNQPESDAQECIDLADGGDMLLVRRDTDTAEIRRLDAPQFEFLMTLNGNACLADALAAADRTGVMFDLRKNLEQWVRTKIITGFSTNVF